jgi:hypothetical protein
MQLCAIYCVYIHNGSWVLLFIFDEGDSYFRYIYVVFKTNTQLQRSQRALKMNGVIHNNTMSYKYDKNIQFSLIIVITYTYKCLTYYYNLYIIELR